MDLVQSLFMAYGTNLNKSSSASEDDSLDLNFKSTDRVDISTSGKFRNDISQWSEDEHAEMRAFHEEMMAAIENGTFDASEMATSAPETLKAFAEENGIDLETMLTDQASRADKGPMGMGPPPLMSVGNFEDPNSQLSDDEKEELRAFYEEIIAAIKNGTFDASEMATSAPEALKNFAEETGNDLETMLMDQASRADKGPMGMGPPPPPMSVGNFEDSNSQLSDAEKEELRAFYEEIIAAIRNGTFNTSEVAANALDILKTL
jgi:DNA-binding FadR family transcriptional regulator